LTIPEETWSEEDAVAMRTLCRQAATLRVGWQKPGNIDQAESLFLEAVEKYPHFWMGHYGLSNVLLFRSESADGQSDLGKRADSLSELRKAVNLAPEQREPLLELSARVAYGDIKEGQQFYQKSVKLPDEEQDLLFPAVWQASQHWRFAVAAAEAELNAIAIEAFCRAIRMDPRRFKDSISPASLRAKNCWKLAVKRLQIPL
jgi:tetratricopeptide (TPR) repeat protein